METIKLGSKGDSVKLLQEKLNLSVDGVFGPNTEKSVKEFQKKNNLTADGIVGNGTWKALGVNVVSTNTTLSSKCVDPSVVYMPLSVHITKSPNRKTLYLAIHYTAGASSAMGKARANHHIFTTRSASADFGVDDKEMVQFNPDIANYYCWAVGDKKNIYSKGGSLNGKATNKNTISIEICSNLTKGTSASAANHKGWFFTDAAIDNAVKLAKIIMKKYNIPIERVVRHYDITGKLCPGVVGWNDETLYDTAGNKTNSKNNSDAWIEFKKRLLK